jgi:transcriptional regulator with XRE-family HTH domain
MAREVRELRKERRLTQKQLAAAFGINQAEISRIERGQTNPTASTLAALLAPLGARVGVVPREEWHRTSLHRAPGRSIRCGSTSVAPAYA